MPDTIVPIVRRPVRRVSTTPASEPKVTELELSEVTRKLSIGGKGLYKGAEFVNCIT